MNSTLGKKPEPRAHAFTLVEMLVAVSIIAFLVSILLPGLSAARRQAQSIVCRSNIRQIAMANGYYAQANSGVYCPGASDFLRNLHRWHGTRDHSRQPFDSTRGPLVPYLGPDRSIRDCPAFPADEIASEGSGFERGNGGYGYNNGFLGVQLRERRSGAYETINDRTGAIVDHVRRPAETIMFTDSGFAAGTLIEYSFAEPRFHPQFPKHRAVPSIHFRHRKTANVVWCDGHADSRRMTLTRSTNLYRSRPSRFHIGWFGQTDDNSLFDLK